MTRVETSIVVTFIILLVAVAIMSREIFFPPTGIPSDQSMITQNK